jgi:hypothetical protein
LVTNKVKTRGQSFHCQYWLTQAVTLLRAIRQRCWALAASAPDSGRTTAERKTLSEDTSVCIPVASKQSRSWYIQNSAKYHDVNIENSIQYV